MSPSDYARLLFPLVAGKRSCLVPAFLEQLRQRYASCILYECRATYALVVKCVLCAQGSIKTEARDGTRARPAG